MKIQALLRQLGDENPIHLRSKYHKICGQVFCKSSRHKNTIFKEFIHRTQCRNTKNKKWYHIDPRLHSTQCTQTLTEFIHWQWFFPAAHFFLLSSPYFICFSAMFFVHCRFETNVASYAGKRACYKYVCIFLQLTCRCVPPWIKLWLSHKTRANSIS